MHKDLDIWKLGIDLVEMIYKLSKKYPKEELYGQEFYLDWTEFMDTSKREKRNDSNKIESKTL